jgi:small subunit ribosomal protein S17
MGKVVGAKCDKTVAVSVACNVFHPIYKKMSRRNKKYLAHDEQNVYKVGDMVNIVESRPFSKKKKWLVLERVGKVNEEEVGNL